MFYLASYQQRAEQFSGPSVCDMHLFQVHPAAAPTGLKRNDGLSHLGFFITLVYHPQGWIT